MKTGMRLVLLAAAVLAVICAALCIGPTQLLDLPKLLALLGGSERTPQLERAALVLWELRVPRVLLAAAAGVSLALGGLLLQTIFRNPLAEPALVGVSGWSVGWSVGLRGGPLREKRDGLWRSNEKRLYRGCRASGIRDARRCFGRIRLKTALQVGSMSDSTDVFARCCCTRAHDMGGRVRPTC